MNTTTLTEQAEIISTASGFWVNLDKDCCIPLTEKGEVVYFATYEAAQKAIHKDAIFIDKAIELSKKDESL